MPLAIVEFFLIIGVLGLFVWIMATRVPRHINLIRAAREADEKLEEIVRKHNEERERH